MGTTRFWFKPSDLRGWVRSVKAGVGTLPALSTKKLVMICYMEAVVEKMVEKMVSMVNKKGSVTEVPGGCSRSSWGSCRTRSITASS